MSAIVALTSLAVYGDGTRGRDGLRVRAAAAGVFEVRERDLSFLAIKTDASCPTELHREYPRSAAFHPFNDQSGESRSGRAQP